MYQFQKCQFSDEGFMYVSINWWPDDSSGFLSVPLVVIVTDSCRVVPLVVLCRAEWRSRLQVRPVQPILVAGTRLMNARIYWVNQTFILPENPNEKEITISLPVRHLSTHEHYQDFLSSSPVSGSRPQKVVKRPIQSNFARPSRFYRRQRRSSFQ